MDRTEMHTEFKFLMDKVDSAASPSFLADEIDRLLNIAQHKFITKRAFGNNVRGTGFEEDQKRRDDLRTLVKNHTNKSAIVDPAEAKPNGFLFKLPDDYRHSINEEAVISTKDVTASSRRVGVKPITHDRYNKIIDDPFNKPGKDTVYRLDFGGKNNTSQIELITGGGQKVDEYHLRYLQEPPQIGIESDGETIGCILPDHTHREIVRIAVVDALETVEQPRYQSSKIELNEIE